MTPQCEASLLKRDKCVWPPYVVKLKISTSLTQCWACRALYTSFTCFSCCMADSSHTAVESSWKLLVGESGSHETKGRFFTLLFAGFYFTIYFIYLLCRYLLFFAEAKKSKESAERMEVDSQGMEGLVFLFWW